MNFDESYFLPEDRDGFHIKSMMKRYWAANLEVLSTIDRICRKHHIRYYADYGTLLGAVRHGGYIPWDDDIDIAMKRVDYERFIKIAPAELPKPMQLFNAKETKMWPLRVVSTFNTRMDEEFLKRFHYCPYSAGVDVFPLDNIPDDEAERANFKGLVFSVDVLENFTNEDFINSQLKKQKNPIELDPDSINECIDMVMHRIDYSLDADKPLAPQLTTLSHILAASYFDKKTIEMANVHDWALDRSGTFKCEDYEETIRLPFESITIPVPKNYDSVLRCIYGDDYMTPKIGTAAHEYPAYCSLEKGLFDYLTEHNYKIPDFLTI